MTGEGRGTLESDQLGTVQVLGLRSDVVFLQSARPLPPGTRVTLREGTTEQVLAEGKVTSVSADPTSEASWEIQVKLFSTGRTTKERMLELAQGARAVGDVPPDSGAAGGPANKNPL